MMVDEVGVWTLIVIGAAGVFNVGLMAIVIRLLYRSVAKQTDILIQIRHLGMASSGILELEEDDED